MSEWLCSDGWPRLVLFMQTELEAWISWALWKQTHPLSCCLLSSHWGPHSVQTQTKRNIDVSALIYTQYFINNSSGCSVQEDFNDFGLFSLVCMVTLVTLWSTLRIPVIINLLSVITTLTQSYSAPSWKRSAGWLTCGWWMMQVWVDTHEQLDWKQPGFHNVLSFHLSLRWMTLNLKIVKVIFSLVVVVWASGIRRGDVWKAVIDILTVEVLNRWRELPQHRKVFYIAGRCVYLLYSWITFS